MFEKIYSYIFCPELVKTMFVLLRKVWTRRQGKWTAKMDVKAVCMWCVCVYLEYIHLRWM